MVKSARVRDTKSKFLLFLGENALPDTDSKICLKSASIY